MTERPTYFEHELMPGKRMFACPTLAVSTMSTQACAERFRTAGAGDRCRGCWVGRQHSADHPAEPLKKVRRAPGEVDLRLRRPEKSTWCPRCSRSGLRIISTLGTCVSCANRQYEYLKGANAKGRPPVQHPPLLPVDVGIELADGSRELRRVDAVHHAEAIARALTHLPAGARLAEIPRPGRSTFNGATGRFEYACDRCGVAGLVLEREVEGRVHLHHWCCSGRDPQGAGWRIAEPRQPVTSAHVDAMAAVLGAQPDLATEISVSGSLGRQVTLPHFCASCSRGQLAGMLVTPGARWRVQCQACAVSSDADLKEAA